MRSPGRLAAVLCFAAAGGCSEPGGGPAPETVSAPVPELAPPVAADPPPDDAPPAPVTVRPVPEAPLPGGDELAAAGLAKLGGGGFVVVTDRPDAAADLPPVVAAARAAWDDYFGPDPSDGRMTAFLMAEPDRFRDAGLLPDDLPPFLTGRQRGRRFWMYEPDEAYFRRALAVHEATHVRMTADLGSGGKGPLWYLEGVAELFGAHRATPGGGFEFRMIPGDEAAAGGWDRIAQVRADVAAGYLPGVDEVRRFGDGEFLTGGGYAWAWALCAFLDGHPAYADRFRDLANRGVRGRLDAAFDEAFAADRRRIDAEWPAFAAGLVPGCERAANAVVFAPGTPLDGERTVRIDAARGWQSAGVTVAAGERVALAADGRFVLGNDPRPWESAAAGISFDYNAGRRVGELQATVLADPPAPPVGLRGAVPVGAGGEFVAPRAGTLYLRLNDRPDRRSENRGGVSVRLAPVPPAPAG